MVIRWPTSSGCLRPALTARGSCVATGPRTSAIGQRAASSNAYVTELRRSGGAQIGKKLEEMTQEILDDIPRRISKAPLVHFAKCAAKLIDIALGLRGCTCGRAPRL